MAVLSTLRDVNAFSCLDKVDVEKAGENCKRGVSSIEIFCGPVRCVNSEPQIASHLGSLQFVQILHT